MVDVLGDRIDEAVVGEGVAEERLPADDIEGDVVRLRRLARLLDIGAVVAGLVGHQDHQDPAVLADQAGVVLGTSRMVLIVFSMPVESIFNRLMALPIWSMSSRGFSST